MGGRGTTTQLASENCGVTAFFVDEAAPIPEPAGSTETEGVFTCATGAFAGGETAGSRADD